MGGVRENCVLRTPKGTAFEKTLKEDEVLKSSSQVIEVIVSQEVKVKGNVDLTVEDMELLLCANPCRREQCPNHSWTPPRSLSTCPGPAVSPVTESTTKGPPRR